MRKFGQLAVLASALSVACATEGERALRADLDRAGETLADLPQVSEDAPLGDDWAHTEDEAETTASFDGTPEAYVAYALAHDHHLRASWERWRAASHRVARERRMPMPALTYAVFISPIETRVGPQRQRLGVRQRFPWPGELRAGADAATATATVEQRKFEAAALDLRARVLRAYWRLWVTREVERVEREQLELFEGLTELARTRLEVGKATLADIQQLELGRARLADRVEGLKEAQISAAAQLLGAVAAPPGSETPTVSALPVLERPQADEASLRATLSEHPLLGRWRAQADAGELRVKEARNARAPAFSLGVDWLEVGPARTSGVADSGKDALSVSVGLELPLWQGNYAEDQRAAEADVAAAHAEWAAARDRAAAELSVTLSRLRDTARRASLHEYTLIPQAEGALESTLGGYVTGEGQLAAILLAERDLLELRLSVVQLHAEHALAWAELERVVGRPLEAAAAAEPTPEPTPEPEPEPAPSPEPEAKP